MLRNNTTIMERISTYSPRFHLHLHIPSKILGFEITPNGNLFRKHSEESEKNCEKLFIRNIEIKNSNVEEIVERNHAEILSIYLHMNHITEIKSPKLYTRLTWLLSNLFFLFCFGVSFMFSLEATFKVNCTNVSSSH